MELLSGEALEDLQRVKECISELDAIKVPILALCLTLSLQRCSWTGGPGHVHCIEGAARDGSCAQARHCRANFDASPPFPLRFF